ncbi:MAG: DUF5665 domain-containing protein [Candidatus Shapirobacteria bacterium]|nr:DUF5665 domain-containing protein [Candidatus Shapirobacteria bacterium]
MTPDEELLSELRKINKKFDVLSNPFKNAAYNFSSGIWHSLGTLFGTVVIAAILVYFFSQLNITNVVTNYIKKLVPQPQINLTVPSVPPSPGQL